MKIIGFIVGGYFLRLPYFEHFIFITNQRADGRFEKSFWDLAFLFFYVNVFTAARAFFLNYVFIPFAKYCQAPINKHQRFAEQSWACVYWSLASAFGIVSIFLIVGPDFHRELISLYMVVCYERLSMVV